MYKFFAHLNNFYYPFGKRHFFCISLKKQINGKENIGFFTSDGRVWRNAPGRILLCNWSRRPRPFARSNRLFDLGAISFFAGINYIYEAPAVSHTDNPLPNAELEEIPAIQQQWRTIQVVQPTPSTPMTTNA